MKKIILIVAIFIEVYVLISIYQNKPIIKNLPKEEIVYVNLKDYKDDYIIGVVSCEMPASFEIEALKAQAVAARTFLEYELSNNNNLSLVSLGQCYNNLQELKNKWQDNYDDYYNKIRQAVIETHNEVMLFDNKLFKSFYFSTSNGYTESSQEVFNEGNIISVSSPWDKNISNYEVTNTFKESDLKNILGSFTTLEIIKRNSTNHVLEVKVDNKIYTGIEFRKLLKLRSTDFDINKIDNYYNITTRGYGHGVGMSQNGAGYLAKEGHDYKYILNYYYNDVKIDKI